MFLALKTNPQNQRVLGESGLQVLSWELPPPSKGRGCGGHMLGVIPSTHCLPAAGECSSHLSDAGAPGVSDPCIRAHHLLPHLQPHPAAPALPPRGLQAFSSLGPTFVSWLVHILRRCLLISSGQLTTGLLLAFNSHHPPPSL